MPSAQKCPFLVWHKLKRKMRARGHAHDMSQVSTSQRIDEIRANIIKNKEKIE